ncbi:thiamine-monophosphate kinase [Chloroherpeton thalassium ATCC 35110]|uniref:Thiamine-monophosphate kinase n=1 Tax=Chloroherpeton thalassium (strain ATCC 35110 / GB-78) TaxID=517418 RepID=B3QYZ8_CHLT3|nr:thiamine-phosphate kinase [Chloroherpeton thalassium]ACF13691.1 thiamine-monophosphate kinase [Chloroherpeton thalassium ATCC 35110]
MTFTKISEIGEFGLIEKISAIASQTESQMNSLKKGIGDDCAILEFSDTEYQVVTTDLLIEQIHFDLLTTPMEHLGAKAISVNVSDICAMNALPTYAVVSIALSEKLSVEMVESLYKGMSNAAKEYGLAIVGGDTSASTAGLVISVTIVGKVKKEKVARRSTAKPGDVVCVSGVLGGSHAGLKVLMRERKLMLDNLKEDGSVDENYRPEIADYQDAVSRHLLPKARLDIVRLFERRGIVPTAMIDISDGLASEIKHICKESKTGAIIEENKFPIMSHARHVADEFEEEATTYALYGGEDYELLFTLSPEDAEKLQETDDVKIIGEIKPEAYGVVMLDMFAREIDLRKVTGYQHFAQPSDESEADEDVWGEDDDF